MKIGKIVSLQPSPKRDVDVRITRDELFSAISEPPGPIRTADVVGYDVAEEREKEEVYYRLYVRARGSRSILFYTTQAQFDVALLLDEFGAALPPLPRSWKKA
jgi:hypothetical protein